MPTIYLLNDPLPITLWVARYKTLLGKQTLGIKKVLLIVLDGQAPATAAFKLIREGRLEAGYDSLTPANSEEFGWWMERHKDEVKWWTFEPQEQ